MESSTTIGMDVGDKHCHLYVLDNESADELEVTRIPTTPAAVARWFGSRPRARVVLEVGGHSGWISRELAQGGHEVVVADARQARLVMGQQQKDDRLDAELLARFGRADPRLLKPVKLRSERAQCGLAVIRSRDALVSGRTSLINHVRGAVKAVGQRLPSCSSESFHRVRDGVPVSLREALEPMISVIEELTKKISALDAVIARMCEEEPATERLRQISGVGPITALTYVLTLEDPGRFSKSRHVGAYLGLCPRRWQSGDADPEMHISKTGDRLLRRLLIQCAHHILGAHAPDSDLKRWGTAHAQGGRVAKKRAIVGVARRLAVLLHRLWISGREYEPLYNSRQVQAAA
jgi:transposase